MAERDAGARYDGASAEQLRHALDLPRVVLFDVVGSTLDVAHELGAQGAPSGTLVLADAQRAGRGRNGRSWSSEPGSGIWLTLVERPRDVAALQVLSIRLGLRSADVLDRWAESPIRLKWPNDLYVGDGKLAGILVESRWREDHIDWVAIGMGVNVRRPRDVAAAAGLREDASRVDILAELVPALRAAATATGALRDAELEAWARRDLARGRRCQLPAAGEVQGIDRAGSLLVRTEQGVTACRAGSLVLDQGALT